MSILCVMICLDRWIKKRVHNWFSYEGKGLRQHFAVWDKITRQLILYNVISNYTTVQIVIFEHFDHLSSCHQQMLVFLLKNSYTITECQKKCLLRIFRTYWLIFSKTFSLNSKFFCLSTLSKKEISNVIHIAKKLQAWQNFQKCL